MLDLADLWQIVGLDGHKDLRERALVADHASRRSPARTARQADVFAAMRAGDVLVHQPYDSFATSVERLGRTRR